MSKLTLPIVAGLSYLQRNGDRLTALRIEGNLVYAAHSQYAQVYAHSGRVHIVEHGNSGLDIVADFIEHTGCVHAANMLLYAQDAAETDRPWLLWETRRHAQSKWVGGFTDHPAWIPHYEYRRKPAVPLFILINGFEVPEPMRVAPAMGTLYWIVHLAAPYDSHWDGLVSGTRILNSGRCHLTKEAAELHTTALLSFTKVTND